MGPCQFCWDLLNFLHWVKTSRPDFPVVCQEGEESLWVPGSKESVYPASASVDQGAPAVSDSKPNWSSFEQTPVFLCLTRLDSVRSTPLKQLIFFFSFSHLIRSMMVSAIQKVSDMATEKHVYPMVIHTTENMNMVSEVDR